MIAVIFDLDETLVNTTPALTELKAEDWHGAEHHISEFSLYDGVLDLIDFLKGHDIPFAIVSTSPAPYCRMILDHFDIDCRCVVGKEAGDKPQPEPVLRALSSLNAEADHAIMFGDKATDIEAAKRAGLSSIGCTWGSMEVDKLLNANPDYVINHPKDGMQVLAKRFML